MNVAVLVASFTIVLNATIMVKATVATDLFTSAQALHAMAKNARYDRGNFCIGWLGSVVIRVKEVNGVQCGLEVTILSWHLNRLLSGGRDDKHRV